MRERGIADAGYRKKAVNTKKKTSNVRGNKADEKMDVVGEDCHPNRSLSRTEEEETIDGFVRGRTNMAAGSMKRKRDELVK